MRSRRNPARSNNGAYQPKRAAGNQLSTAQEKAARSHQQQELEKIVDRVEKNSRNTTLNLLKKFSNGR